MHIPISSTGGIFTPMQPSRDHCGDINRYYIVYMEISQSVKANSVGPDQT